MKKFVDDEMLSQMKITLTIDQNKNISTTKTNGGFIQISKVLTMALRHRSDFKQALSKLERLHQEAGEEPHGLTYFYKHKQWQLAQSSWWNWQGSWWVLRSRRRHKKAKALWEIRQPRMQEKNTTIPRVKTASWQETRQDEHFGKST